MSSGLALFQLAETSYHRGNIPAAFENYQKAIKKILKDENPTAEIPGIGNQLPKDFPRELLGIIWRNFVGFFRDPSMNFTEASAPEAYKLLNSFRPTAPTSPGQKRLGRTSRGKVLLKGMQVTASLTLGLIAWDKGDRATAAKRYREGIDLAATHASFQQLPPGTVGMELYVHNDLQQVKENLDTLIQNDKINAEMVKKSEGAQGQEPRRREEVDLPVPQMRVDKTGAITMEDTVKFATNACANCGKRDIKLQVCSLCKKAYYCNSDCQKADWKKHKKTSCVKS